MNESIQEGRVFMNQSKAYDIFSQMSFIFDLGDYVSNMKIDAHTQTITERAGNLASKGRKWTRAVSMSGRSIYQCRLCGWEHCCCFSKETACFILCVNYLCFQELTVTSIFKNFSLAGRERETDRQRSHSVTHSLDTPTARLQPSPTPPSDNFVNVSSAFLFFLMIFLVDTDVKIDISVFQKECPTSER